MKKLLISFLFLFFFSSSFSQQLLWSTIETDTIICQAIQMNGNQCKAKAKDGKFCGRHCKK